MTAPNAARRAARVVMTSKSTRLTTLTPEFTGPTAHSGRPSTADASRVSGLRDLNEKIHLPRWSVVRFLAQLVQTERNTAGHNFERPFPAPFFNDAEGTPRGRAPALPEVEFARKTGGDRPRVNSTGYHGLAPIVSRV